MAEPNTSGKIVLCTTQGDLDIELWSNEIVLASRHFVQNAVDGMYLNAEFSIAEGLVGLTPKVPLETPFKFTKVETNSRLRFQRRGMVAVCLDEESASVGNIIIATAPASWLDQKRFIIVGTVVGNTVYNLHNISTCAHEDGQPINPIVVTDVKILKNPFHDMRAKKINVVQQVVAPAVERKAVKNAALLSFDDGEDEFVDILRMKRKTEKQKKEQDRMDKEQLENTRKAEEQKKQIEENQKKALLLERLDKLIEQDTDAQIMKVQDIEQRSSGSRIPNLTNTVQPAPAKKGKFQKRKDKGEVDETEALQRLKEFKTQLITSRAAAQTDSNVSEKPASSEVSTYLNIEQFSAEEQANWLSHRFETTARPQDAELHLSTSDKDVTVTDSRSDHKRDRDYRK